MSCFYAQMNLVRKRVEAEEASCNWVLRSSDWCAEQRVSKIKKSNSNVVTYLTPGKNNYKICSLNVISVYEQQSFGLMFRKHVTIWILPYLYSTLCQVFMRWYIVDFHGMFSEQEGTLVLCYLSCDKTLGAIKYVALHSNNVFGQQHAWCANKEYWERLHCNY